MDDVLAELSGLNTEMWRGAVADARALVVAAAVDRHGRLPFVERAALNLRVVDRQIASAKQVRADSVRLERAEAVRKLARRL